MRTFNTLKFSAGIIVAFFLAGTRLSAQVAVTGSTGADGNYANLGAAFTAINSGSQTGNTISISVTASVTEPASAVLNAGTWTSLTIQPSGGAFTIDGTLAAPLIDLNGADNVTINGLNAGGNALTLSNLSTVAIAATSTIRFANDATGNLVTNCTILGSSTGAVGATLSTGTILIAGSTGSTGNDNITISNNNIGDAGAGATLPSMAISSVGQSTAIANDNITVSGNNIYNWYLTTGANAINVGANSSAWTISANKFYQTAARSGLTSANYLKAIFISTTSGGGYAVTGNTIGYASSTGTGVFTNSGGRFTGIEISAAASPVSSIQNNTITALNLTTASSAATLGAAFFNGIIVNAGAVNIGTTTGNVIGAASGTGAIVLTTTTSGSGIYPIYGTSAASLTIQNNTIGSISTGGAAAIGYSFTGIAVAGSGSHIVSSNLIGTATASSISIGTSAVTTAATVVTGVSSSATGTTENLSSNTIQNINSYGSATGSNLLGVVNTGACGTLTISNTIFTANNVAGAGSSSTLILAAVSNSGSVTGTVNITNTTFSNSTLSSASTAGAIALVYVSGAGSASMVNITGNTITGVTFTGTTGGTGTSYGIYDASATASKTISNNTFNNLSLKTSGSFYFIYNSSSTNNYTISNNSIVTGFAKTVAGGTVYLYYNFGGPSGGTATIDGNNFSNITLTGATAFDGIEQRTSTSQVEIITNNTVNNVTTGASTAYGIYHGYGASGSSISGNTITGISGGSTVYGIYIGSTAPVSLNCATNTVGNLSSSGASAVYGIYHNAGTATTISRNKIYGLSGSNTSSTIFGVYVSSGTTVTIQNNLIGNLSASIANATNPVNGIYINGGTTVNAYYNTVYLNASSTGLNFGSSGIYTLTSPTVDLRNNLVVNLSTPSGTGLTVAYRRSSTTLTTYASTSNNNSFYAGTPSASNLIFNDGTNSDQTIAAFRTRVSTRDLLSISQNPTFSSTTGASASFLHIPAASSTPLESGGAVISGLTVDYDNDTRPGPVGSVNGGGTAPDIGADEFDGTPATPVINSISASPAANQCTATPRTITANITPVNPLNSVTLAFWFNGVAQTPVVMTGGNPTATSNWTGTIPAATPVNAVVTWSVVASDGTYASTSNGTPYQDAPATGITATAVASPASICTGSSTVLTASFNPVGPSALGAGGSTSSSYESPFYHLFGGLKDQFLIKASELTALGFTAGNITSLGLDVVSGGNTYNTFEINIASVGATSALTTTLVNSGFTTVYSAASVTTVASGIQTFNFSTPFVWDGVSNIVVQFCWSNNNTGGTSTTVRYDAQAFTCHAYYRADSQTAAALCGTTSGTSTSSNRPKFIFTGIPVATAYAWSDGSTTVGTTNPLTVTPAATTNYSCALTYAGCPVNTNTITVTVGAPLSATSGATPSVNPCIGSNLTLNASGVSGGAPYTYAWSGPNGFTSTQQNPAITGITAAAAGTYTCVITDACTSTFTVTVAITVSPLPTITVSPSSPSYCYLGTPVALSASGASTYSWAPSAGLSATTGASVNASPVTATTYTITGTDANGCSATSTSAVTVTYGPAVVNATASPATICSGNNAQLNAVASGNNPALFNTYTYSTGTGTSLDPMTGATTVIGSSVDDTPTASPAAIGFNFLFNGTVYTQYSVSPDGWLMLGGTTAASEYTNAVTSTSNLPKLYPYWDDLATGTTGNVKVLVTGTAPNRIFKVQWFVTIPRNTTGAANSTFQAWLYEATGVIEYRYGTMGSGSMSASLGGTASSTNYQSITIPANTVSISSANDANSAQPASGTLFRFTPPAPAYTYSWSPATFLSNTAIANPMANAATTSTTYTVSVANGGCSSTGTVALTVNPLPVITASAGSAVICAGSSTTLTATGGTTYTWMPGSLSGSTVSVSPTVTTTYTVTGVDGNSCSNTQTVTVTVNPLPSVTSSASPSATVCSGTSVTLTGAGASTYSWSGGITNGVAFTASATTTYTLTGTDANGCSNTTTQTVTVNALPVVTATASSGTICAGNSTTLTSSGASTYTWMPGSLSGSSVSVSPASSTTYTVTGTSAAGCTNTETVTVTVNALPAVTASASAAAICNGNSVTLTSSGASTYTWMPGSLSGSSVTDSPSSTTTYTVTGTSVAGCTNTETVTVTVNAVPVVTATAASSSICNGSSTSLTAGGASTYSWMPGSLSGSSVSVTPSSTTTYTVTGTSAAGCTNTETVTVTVNALPVVTASASSATICNGSSSTLTAGGASTYSWMPGSLSGSSVSVTPSSTTTYTVTGTSAAGCTSTETVIVTVNALPSVSASAASSAVCNGNGTTLTATGASIYSWMPGSLSGSSVSVTPSSSTTYTVTGTDANGCVNTNTVAVTVNPLPAVAASATSTSICTGNSVTLNATGTADTYVWNPGSLSGSSVSVTPASTTTYTVTGTITATGCTSTATVAISVGAQPVVTASSANSAICNGNSTTLTGSGAATYTWMPGSLSGTSVSVSPSTTTTYTVTGVVSAGCQNTATVTVTVNPTPTVTASASSAAICTGSTTTLTASGASTYSWMPGSLSGTSVTVSPSSSTIYTVTGTSAAGCSGIQTVAVTVHSLPTVTASSAAPVICNGSSTTLTASGASTYSWMPGSLSGTSVSVTPSSNTTYTVTGTDANGCVNTGTVAVAISPSFTVAVSSSSNVTCNGGSNGSATVAASGGTGTLSYAWAPSGGNAATASGLTAGTYTCMITDFIGCSTTVTVSITQPAALASSVSAQTNILCHGASSGAATIAVTGGTGSYTYSWSPSGGNAATATGLAAGTYTVNISDANSCTHSQVLTITEPSAISSFVAAQVNVSCNGNNTGSATINATGGTGTLTYAWAPTGGTAASASSLIAGIYTCTITDANGCTHSQNVTITQPSAITSSVASAVNVTCNAGNNGAATINASGGTGTLAYNWTPSGGTAATANGLTAGTYTCTITDANTCTHQQTVTITEPAAVTGTVVSSTNATCGSGNGAATISATGGTGSYTYSWAPAGGTGTSASGLFAGIYTVTITDGSSCTGSVQLTINNSGAATVSLVSSTNVTCNGGNNGAATISATGGTGTLTYDWTPGTPAGDGTTSVTGLTAGLWSCTVTDANGCLSTQTVNITEPSAISSFVAAQTNVSCNGGNNGSATVSASGGTGTLGYSWSSGGTTATENNLAAGIYTVTITDANSCSSTQLVTITEPSAITASVASLTDASCNGIADGTATISANGGTGTLSYSWAPAGGTNASASGLAAGTYTVTISDVNACSASQTLTITEPVPVAVTANASATTVCYGTAVTLTGSGTATSYSWSGGVTDGLAFSAVATDTYVVTGTDANGCSNTDTITVAVNALPLVAANASAVNVCEGTQVTLTGSGTASSYSWSGGVTDGVAFAATVSGSYTVTGTDANGCSDTSGIYINVNALPVVALGADQAVCSGTVLLDAQNAGSTYLWNDNSTSQTLVAASTGIYWVDVTNASGCTSRDSVTITINANPVVALGNDSLLCGGSLVLDAQNPGATYVWNDNSTSQTLTVTTSGTYYVTATYTGGCFATDTINVTINSVPVVSLGNDSTQCGGSVVIDAQNAGSTYLWNDNSSNQTLTASATGIYWVDVTNAAGCTTRDSVSITINAIPAVAFVFAQDSICKDDAPLTLSGAPAGGTFSGPGISGNSFDPSALNGTQTITYSYTDSNTGCAATASDFIVVDACTGIEEHTLPVANVYPNPNLGQFTIDLGYLPASPVKIEITNSLGQLVQEFMMTSNTKQVDLGIYEGGVYSVRITDGNSVSVVRVVKQ